MTNGHIQDIPTSILAGIVAGLVREGVTFNVTPTNDNASLWNIELTGGY